MDLSSVNPIGVIAFSCFKFAAYVLAFVLLKRLEPAIQASAMLMAGARTVLGVVAGGTLYLGWDALRHRLSGFYNFSYEILPYYLILVLLRILVWLATILFFSRKSQLSAGKACLYAAGGAAWSSLIDIPAGLFTFLVPGGVLFCRLCF